MEYSAGSFIIFLCVFQLPAILGCESNTHNMTNWRTTTLLVAVAVAGAIIITTVEGFERDQLRRLKRIGMDRDVRCEVDQYWNNTLSECHPCTHCQRVRGKSGGYLWTIR